MKGAHRVAFSFALGVAIGVIPGTGAIVAAALATALRLNLPMAVAGALLNNPFTTPFVYAASYALGHWLLGDHLPDNRWGKIAVGTLAGNIILALAAAAVSYVVLFFMVRWIKLRKAAHRAARH